MRWPTLRREIPVPVSRPLAGRRIPRPAMTVGVLVYRGVTTADIDLPVTALADRLDADIVFVGSELGVVPGVEPSRPVAVDLAPTDGYAHYGLARSLSRLGDPLARRHFTLAKLFGTGLEAPS